MKKNRNYSINKDVIKDAEIKESTIIELVEMILKIFNLAFTAELHYKFLAKIGEYSEKINSMGFGSIFNVLQMALQNNFSLEAAKIFDKPHKRYRTNSLFVLLSELHKINSSAMRKSISAWEIKIQEINPIIEKIKNLRDKFIAHDEYNVIEKYKPAKFMDYFKAIDLAKNICADSYEILTNNSIATDVVIGRDFFLLEKILF